MATRKSKTAAPVEDKVAEAQPTTPEAQKPQMSAAQKAGTLAYNAAYLAEVRAAAALGPIDGQRLVQAHYRARTALKADIAVSNHVCPMCGGQPVAV